ncbi:MAG: TolB family protein, partial [Anaerolineae bacterium]
PDGFQIAFSSDPPDVDIHLINADGTGRRRVTNDPTAEYWPHWSPDAGLFAIHYGRRGGPSDVFTVTADGSTYRRVTATGDASHPRWGPGGTEIVYSRTAGGDADVWAVDPVTLATRPVVAGPGFDHQPTWLPDASRILFVRGRETDADAEIWSVKPDGTGAVNLTKAPGSREMWPATACLPPAEVATPTPPPARECVCSWLRGRVPGAVIADALANPDRYFGWRQPRNPGLPPGPANPPRECLSLENRGVAYHPVYNRPIWRVGCP